MEANSGPASTTAGRPGGGGLAPETRWRHPPQSRDCQPGPRLAGAARPPRTPLLFGSETTVIDPSADTLARRATLSSIQLQPLPPAFSCPGSRINRIAHPHASIKSWRTRRRPFSSIRRVWFFQLHRRLPYASACLRRLRSALSPTTSGPSSSALPCSYSHKSPTDRLPQ